MRIIPAIDIINGKCVRLSKGNYDTMKIYNEDPLEVAKEFEGNGIRYLHLVDLDGAKSKQIVNHKVLYQIANKTTLQIDFGGGIKSLNDVRIAFENGARQITGGSIAAKQPDIFTEWLEQFGNVKIILGADCKNRKIATNGWQNTENIDVLTYIQYFEQVGIQYVICTDIEKDGMLAGPSTELYQEIIENTNIKLIASGGITTIDDVLMMNSIGCEGVIIGKAIYEQKITLTELSKLC
jgi:phosphoribosylformimino-5-aminoimidazole carboxamide ribotide isomerase